MKDKSIRLSIALNIILGAIFTILIYQVLGIYGENKIISEDMLRALKAYTISDIGVLRNKLIFRIIMLVSLCVLYLKKKVNIIKLIFFGCCIRLGLIFMLFFLEMKLYGVINYICIIAPSYIIYMVILKHIYESCRDNTYQRKIKFFLYVIGGWSIGILYELVIKMVMVHHCLIVCS